MSRPTRELMNPSKRVLRYLRGMPDLPTVYHKGNLELNGYCDASFAAMVEQGRSCVGFLFMLRGAATSLATTLQKLAAQSTVEAELIAIHRSAQTRGDVYHQFSRGA